MFLEFKITFLGGGLLKVIWTYYKTCNKSLDLIAYAYVLSFSSVNHFFNLGTRPFLVVN